MSIGNYGEIVWRFGLGGVVFADIADIVKCGLTTREKCRPPPAGRVGKAAMSRIIFK